MDQSRSIAIQLANSAVSSVVKRKMQKARGYASVINERKSDSATIIKTEHRKYCSDCKLKMKSFKMHLSLPRLEQKCIR